MRRAIYIIIIAISTLIGVSHTPIFAIPAKRGVITVIEPDGNELNIKINGDEFFAWRTTEDGYPITQGEDGYYYYAYYTEQGKIATTSQRVSINGAVQTPPPTTTTRVEISTIASRKSSQQRAARQRAQARSSENGFPSSGTVHAVVILAEFADTKFSVENPKEAFHNQLNLEGYSVGGAAGSAKDYFNTNSKGQFDGNFDVYGPYTLPNNRKYYGGNDRHGYDLRPDTMVLDAVKLANKDIDFSQYDLDEDGIIDNIFVYYAGHNEAEGASEDTVWPHAWGVPSRPKFDGKTLRGYACTSELRGSTGAKIAGIGTFCHEFGHILGLADHYDTNDSTNGLAYGLGYYDIMTSGSYNNNGNNPPIYNGLELDMVGWNTPKEITEAGEITIEPIDQGEVYRINTEVEGEYFLIENRYKETPNHPWDKYIAASGLFITHIDRSKNYISRWYANEPNAYSNHPCFRFVVAGNESLSDFKQNEYLVPYPSTRGNNEWSTTSKPAATSWGGKELTFNITDITRGNAGAITFNVVQLIQSAHGAIKDATTGVLIENATVKFYPTSDSSTPQPIVATTDENGAYSIALREGEYQVEISAKNYQTTSRTVDIKQGDNIADFTILSYASIMSDIEVIGYQNSAMIKWNPKGYSIFLLKLNIKGDTSTKLFDSKECQIEIEQLDIATKYEVTILGKNQSGEYDELYAVDFATLGRTTSIPIICLDKYRYSKGQTINLHMLNCRDDDQVSWEIDSKPLYTNKITPEVGEHTITGIVKRGDKSYSVHKKIHIE